MTSAHQSPPAHPSGAVAPDLPEELKPRHIAIVMDGNGRWANERGMTRTEGHKAGELAVMEVVAGAVEMGIEYVSLYAFSTENWKRSPDEVRFLMGFSRDILRSRRETFHSWNVRILWSGREPRLWKSVINELKVSQERTRHNTGTVLNMCVNYGGRAEIIDAVNALAAEVKLGKVKPGAIKEASLERHLYNPELPDVDLFLRTSGEQRTSNFLPWQSTYAEFVFLDRLWPDMDRMALWDAVESYARRDRRYGGAQDRAASDRALPQELPNRHFSLE